MWLMRTIYLRLKEQVYLTRKPCKIAINGDGSSKAKALNSCEDTVCDTSSIQCREWIEMLSETLALALLTYLAYAINYSSVACNQQPHGAFAKQIRI